MTRLPRILYAVPQLPHVHLEIAKAIQTLWGKENERAANGSVTKAAVGDPEHPGWPAHAPDGMGGEFRPKDGAFNSPITIPPLPGEGQSAPAPNVRLALWSPSIRYRACHFLQKPRSIDWAEGEVPGGGGFGGRSAAKSSEAAAAAAQSSGPQKIVSFTPPDNLTYGTTLFGNYAHAQNSRPSAELVS